MAYLAITDVYGMGFTAYIADLDTSYGTDDREIDWYLDGYFMTNMALGAGVSESDSYYFTGLNADTEYYVEARIFYNDNGTETSKVITGYAHTESRPNKFYWDEEKNAGEPFNITATEWCNLLDNINEVLVFAGKSEMDTTTNPSATARFYYPSKGDNFLAATYNQCIYAFERLELLDYDDYRVDSG